MSCTVKTMRVGDHPTEDTFEALHTPRQDARTNAVLDRVGRVVFGSARGPDVNPTITLEQEWDSPLPPHMMNTGRTRDEQRRRDERRHASAPPVPRIGGLRIYLAGPMSGIKEFNFPAFNAAAAMLRSHGHEVFNPAEADVQRHGVNISLGNETGDQAQAVRDHGFSLDDALCHDTHYICKVANAIAMLPGWESSKGARAEHALAFALGRTFIYLGSFYG